MIESIDVIGRGRVGGAVRWRALLERGLSYVDQSDAARAALRPGSRDRRRGGRDRARPLDRTRQRRDAPLRALEPHVRRFSVAPAPDVHRRPWAGAARRRLGGRHGRDRRGARGRDLAGRDARPAAVRRSPTNRKPLYHAGAAIASNYLVTLRRPPAAAARGGRCPPEALDPLMRRTIENDFELTGSDRSAATGRPSSATCRRSRQRAHLLPASTPSPPSLLGSRLAGKSDVIVARTVDDVRAALEARRDGRSASCRRWARCTRGHLSLIAAARERSARRS